MHCRVDRSGTLAGFQDAVQAVLADDGVRGLLAFTCDANGFTPALLDRYLRDLTVPLFGGVFPQVLHQQEILLKGSVVLGLTSVPEIAVFRDLSHHEGEFVELVDQALGEVEPRPTMFVFLDGFSRRIGSFIDALFTIFGLEGNYLGGGAGSLSMVQKPCVLTPEGLIEDGAVLALVDLPSGVGVSHGWRSVSGPFQVTSSDRNVIRTLDWQPAFEVYRQVVDAASRVPITPENFFDVAKAYPFGIARLGAERVVRDPLRADPDGSLVCVGEVPQGSFVDILTGDAASLVEAAGQALDMGVAGLSPAAGQVPQVILIDCISRVLFLEDRFGEELMAVGRHGWPLVGACTIGEIANSGGGFLEFYNKTSVVGVLGR